MVAGKVDIRSPKGKKIASIEMPQSQNDPNFQSALMWYFVSWSQRLKGWSRNKRMRYASEIGKITSYVPIHMLDINKDKSFMQKMRVNLKLKLFDYKNNKFIMLDEKGKVLSEMSGMRLYALFAYLIDSLSTGLQDQTGFDYVKMAKELIKYEKK